MRVNNRLPFVLTSLAVCEMYSQTVLPVFETPVYGLTEDLSFSMDRAGCSMHVVLTHAEMI